MSEYQYVVFQAVDGPLNDKQLKFAEQQSSRAEVSRWSLTVEYNYSSFRGDIEGLLRNGYDVYLSHTSYGSREVKLRLPHGMPFAKSVWQKYAMSGQLEWKSDTKGSGGILSLHPGFDPGELDQVWETQAHLDAVIAVREHLMRGDLRALYLLWLCAARDDYNDPDELIEPPVPHGIAESVSFGDELLTFFDIDPLLLVAAGDGIAPAPSDNQKNHSVRQWVESLNLEVAQESLYQLLTSDAQGEKARLLARIRDSQTQSGWPTTDKRRTLSELSEKSKALRAEENERRARKDQEKAKRAAAKAERERISRMKEMVVDPNKWLLESSRLVEARGRDNYMAAAEILYDLREAIGGNEGINVTRHHAASLVKTHPTLNVLKGSLRKRGLID